MNEIIGVRSTGKHGITIYGQPNKFPVDFIETLKRMKKIDVLMSNGRTQAEAVQMLKCEDEGSR